MAQGVARGLHHHLHHHQVLRAHGGLALQRASGWFLVDFAPGSRVPYLIWELGCMEWGRAGEELEKTVRVAPGTDCGDNALMGVIRRQEQCLPVGRAQRGSRAVAGAHICISEVIDISPGNLDSCLCFIQPGISRDVLCI